MDDFERKWKIIQEHLFAEATGAEPRPFSSGRTLFGIKSEAEQKMERFAREIEEEQLDALRKDAQESVGEFGTEGPEAPSDKKNSKAIPTLSRVSMRLCAHRAQSCPRCQKFPHLGSLRLGPLRSDSPRFDVLHLKSRFSTIISVRCARCGHNIPLRARPVFDG